LKLVAAGRRRTWRREFEVAQYEAYCMKCRQKRTFEGQVVELKNGRPAAQGTCPVCGTKLTRILSKAEAGK
jgi:Zn finger protein HypA/HybF involved in hydrogenase expression